MPVRRAGQGRGYIVGLFCSLDGIFTRGSRATTSASAPLFNLFNGNAVMLIKNLNMALPGFGDPAQVLQPLPVWLGVRWS